MPDFAPPSPQGLMDLAWLALLHSAWLGMLAGALGALAIGLGRPASHRARHATLVASLMVVAIAAPAAAVAQRWVGRREDTSSFVHAMVRPTVPIAASSPPDAIPKPPPRPARAPGWGERFRLGVAAAGSFLKAARPYLLACWAAGASASAAALLVGAFAAKRLRREAVPQPALEGSARMLARRLRLRRLPAIGDHPRILEPCLVGAVRPMVLFPSRWLGSASAAEVEAVLAHELAHARRLDHRTNPIQRCVEAVLWFHPGVRKLSRLARREAEHAADALAARVTGDPLALARALDSVARQRRSRLLAFSPGLAASGDRSTLLPRIQELLGMKPIRPQFPYRILAALPMSAALAGLAISTAPAQESPYTLGTIDIAAVTPRQIDEPADPAQAAWEKRVQDLRARVENPDSNDYAMYVLYRLVPGNPRLAQSTFVDPRPRADLAPGDLTDDVLIRLASKRPWRLSHEDLVTLARTMPHGRGDVAGLSREELLQITDENQVSFAIHILQVQHDPAAVPPEHQEVAAKSVHPIPGIAVHELIKTLSEKFPNAAKHGPTVMTFEGGSAIISLTDKPSGDRLLEAVKTAGERAEGEVRLVAHLEGPAPGPNDDLAVTSRLHGDLCLQLTGIRKPWGHAVEARFLGVIPGDPKAPDAAPRSVERLARINVPEGDGILLDTGIEVYGGEKDDSGKHIRTLIVITPRHILNERETEAISGPVDEFRTAAK